MAGPTFKVDDKDFTDKINKLIKYTEDTLPKKLLKEFKRLTPIDSGNARRKTKLQKKKDKNIIDANYPYARVLDEGMFPNPPKKGTGKTHKGYSTQALDGMSSPTIEKGQDLLDKYIRKI